jgi:hypothetical protein
MTITTERLVHSFAALQYMYTVENEIGGKHHNVNQLEKNVIGTFSKKDSLYCFKSTGTPVIPKDLEVFITIKFGSLQTKTFLKSDYNNLREITPFGIEPRLFLCTKTWVPIEHITVSHSIENHDLSEKINKATKIANDNFKSQNQPWIDYFKSCFALST